MTVGRNRAERDCAEHTLPRTVETQGEGGIGAMPLRSIAPYVAGGFPPPGAYFCGQ